MLAFVLKRLALVVPTFLGITLLVFSLIRLIPGDPVEALSGERGMTEERYQRFGAEHPEVIIARQGAGLRRARPISSAAAGFLAASDGEYSAAQLITAVCSLTETEESVLQEEVLDLYVEGFLS